MNNVVTRSLVLLAVSTAIVLTSAFVAPPAKPAHTTVSTDPEGMAGHDMGDMGGAVTSEETFITNMIPHHQEAVESARAVLATTERPQVRELAQAVIDTQTAEIDTLEGWLGQFYPDAGEAEYAPMMTSLAGLSPDEADRTFLKDMIVHHRGAIDMARAYLDGSFEKRADVTQLAEAIMDAQEGEITQMQGWLEDGYGEADADHGSH